ncbi:hypothetical protein ACRN9J_17670 [Shewanella baltica]|uniref:hypothetical protein n=1 Tax=Shewanella baltica TaxID=62322 RepID=UPI003D7ACFF6
MSTMKKRRLVVLYILNEFRLSTAIPVTRHKLIPEGSTAASMPPTVTYMPVLNPINKRVF